MSGLTSTRYRGAEDGPATTVIDLHLGQSLSNPAGPPVGSAVIPAVGQVPVSRASALSGVQKVAVLMMDLEPDVAARVMAHFTEDEAQQISAEIIRMRSADAPTVDAVVHEMAALVNSGHTRVRGGAALARQLVAGAFGEDRATGVLEGAEGVLAGRAFEFLEHLEPARVLALLAAETPQAMAVVLSNLDPRTASTVLSGLEVPVRNEVARRIAVLGTPSPDAVQALAEILRTRLSSLATAREQAEVGGVQSLVDIVWRADSATERGVLEYMDATDPDLGNQVRERMFSFSDLPRLDALALQRVLRSVRTEVLARALRRADPAVDETVRANLSARNVAALEEAIAGLPRLRQTEVEEARGELVRVVREMVTAGELDLTVTEDDYV